MKSKLGYHSLGRKVFDSSLWMVAWQWSARVLGLISTIILARLLTPHDYGIVASAMLVISFIEILTVLGGDRYLIRTPNVDAEDFNTAWTIRFIQYSFISTLLWFSSSYVALFFNENSLCLVVQVLSFFIFISAFENIGLVKLKRDLEFSQLFKFGICQKGIGFVVTVTLAVILKNYWAIIIGFAALRVSGTILSYIISDYRPRFAMSRAKTQWSFSQWILLGNCAVYLRNKVDQLIVGRIFSINTLGTYNVGVEVANMPTTAFTTPISHAVFSGLAQLVETPKELESSYIKLLGSLACFIMPISIGLSSVAPNMVELLLGQQWVGTIPIIQSLSIMAIPIAYSISAIDFLTINNLVKEVCFVDWLVVIILIPLLLFFSIYGDIQQVALVRTIYAFFSTFLYFLLIRIRIGINIVSLLMVIIRPVFSAVVMAIMLNVVGNFLNFCVSVNLILQVLLGALVYSFVLLAVWLAFGKPKGGERIILDRLREKINL